MSQEILGLGIPDLSGPATMAHQSVNGIDLHHVQAGSEDAPLVILLHGFADFWWGWRRQIGRLTTAGFLVVAPDQRGYNLSGKPVGLKAYDIDTLAADIVGLADAYGRKKFYVIGHDFGGLIAWWIATRYPDRVERLVAINAFHPQVLIPYFRKRPTQLLRSIYMGVFRLPWFPEWLLKVRKFAVMRGLLRISSHAGTFSDADMKRYVSTWASPGALAGMLNWYRALLSKPLMKNARVKIPTLVIWGLCDHFLERGLAEESLALCDNGKALWVENGTHFVHIEEPALVNKALIDFLRT